MDAAAAAAAALLSPHIMPEVDCNSNTLSAELEVKKLQELVRKLERQNEQLRTRAGGCAGGPYALPPSPTCAPGSPANYRPPSPLPSLLSVEPFDYFQTPTEGHGATDEGEEEEEAEDGERKESGSLLDELELLDLDDVWSADLSDETWLHTSSKAQDCSDSGTLSALQWSRHVLDSNKLEVEAARRSLSLRLEQVSRWRSSLCSPSSSASSLCPSPSRLAAIGASPSAKLCSTPQPSERHGRQNSFGAMETSTPPPCSPLHPSLHQALSPVARDLSPAVERIPTFLPHLGSRGRSLRRATLSPQSSLDGDGGVSEVEEDCIALGYKLQDLTDVQVMARIQEESLRQDYASMAGGLANRRSQSFSFQLSAGLGLEEEDEEEDEDDYGLLPPPQPRLTRLPHSHTFSSIRDWRRSTSSLSTPPSTPPYPSAGVTFQSQLLGLASPCAAEPQGFRPGSAEYESKLRRSMPNLVRAPSMPSVPIPTNPSASPALLRNSQSFDSSSGLARLQSSIPSPGQLQNRVQSVGNFASLSRPPLKATAYVSPTIKGSASIPASASLQSLNIGSSSSSGSGIPLLSKPVGSSSGSVVSSPVIHRSSLPRPASFIGTINSTPRSKIGQPARSLLTPPKSLSTFSALRDGAWRDGCY